MFPSEQELHHPTRTNLNLIFRTDATKRFISCKSLTNCNHNPKNADQKNANQILIWFGQITLLRLIALEYKQFQRYIKHVCQTPTGSEKIKDIYKLARKHKKIGF